MTLRNLALSSSLTLLGCAYLMAQTVSSSMVGTVVDPAGSVVPGAPIQLTNQGTAAISRAATDGSGLFRFPNLNPGTYSVSIQAKGFKTRVERDIVLGLSETRELGRMSLEIGNVNEQITVTAETTPVQLASAEKSATIDGTQLNTEAIKGRDMMSYMRLLPGVVDTSTARDATGGSILGGLTFNGSTGITSFAVDGVTDIDAGCSSCFAHFEPNIDSISEIKVLTSNYQAEFGRNAGGAITVVTKSGTQQFHGSGWWTHRHEQFNANDFFNNQTGLPRSRYRFNIAGWSLGGPVFIPHLFNVHKTKVFLFASQEYTEQLANFGNQYRSMPTQLERNGDYSHSVNGSGALITITDPLNNNAPFPGNTIPQNRINGWGQSILNFFPLPNTFFPQGTPQYLQDNFQAAGSGTHPRRNDIARLDVIATSKLNGYFRYGHDKDDWEELFQNIQWLQGIQDHPNPGHGFVWSVNYVASPTLINQFTYGISRNNWSWFELNPSQVDRSLFNGATGTPQAGLPLPSLFPLHPPGPGVGGYIAEGPANSSNGYAPYLPGVSFGSAPPGAASFAIGNPEYTNYNSLNTFTDNLTKILGSHSIKAGVYVELNRKIQPCGSSGCNGYYGSYSFAPDSSNPLNTGDGYANALLGYFDTYSEATAKEIVNVTYWNTEFYVQDNWRIGKRLTLDYGIRLYNETPQIDHDKFFSYFSPAAYKLSAVPRLYVPAIVDGKRVAQDPSTGATAPAAEVGLYVPGTGSPANGMVNAGVNGAPMATYSTAPLVPAPRVGFAYDVFGNGKTAIRGGFGVFFDRLDGNQVYNMANQPPTAYTPTAYYGQIGGLANSGGAIGPSTIAYWAGHTVLPSVRSASFSIQQNIGFGTVLDVSYQGTFGLNRNVTENMNAIPIGANFQPQYQDPTAPGKPLSSNFERILYPGMGNLNQLIFNGKSNYNALQTTLRRRLSHGLLFGLAHSWSRSMALLAFDPLVANNYSRNYGPQGSDRRQTLAINFAYDIPTPGLRNRALTAVIGGWQLSGITTFVTGAPFTPSFTTTNGLDITGSTNEGARINVVGNPLANVPSVPGLANGKLAFNPAAFSEPAVGTIGTAGVNIMYGPGYSNWDMSLTKSMPVGLGEKRRLSMRLEAFNVFNHTQFSGVNSSFTFNANGVNTNAATGTYTGDRGPRIMSLELRFQF